MRRALLSNGGFQARSLSVCDREADMSASSRSRERSKAAFEANYCTNAAVTCPGVFFVLRPAFKVSR